MAKQPKSKRVSNNTPPHVTEPTVVENDKWPLLQVALLCFAIIEDKDNSMSVIKILDKIVIVPETPLSVDGPSMLKLSFMIGFKSGDAMGERTLVMDLETPSGKTRTVAHANIILTGKENGVAVRGSEIPLWYEGPGLYWYHVRLKGKSKSRFYTKMPLVIVSQAEQAPK